MLLAALAFADNLFLISLSIVALKHFIIDLFEEKGKLVAEWDWKSVISVRQHATQDMVLHSYVMIAK